MHSTDLNCAKEFSFLHALSNPKELALGPTYLFVQSKSTKQASELSSCIE